LISDSNCFFLALKSPYAASADATLSSKSLTRDSKLAFCAAVLRACSSAAAT